MGEKADRIFKTFTYGSGESADKYDVVIKNFEQYFVPKRNVIYERSMFHARKQSENETVEQYYSDLHALVQKCSYPDEMQDEMLRDRLVLGLRDKDTQCKLYMQENLTIAKAVDIARQAELIRQQMKASAHGDIHEMKRSVTSEFHLSQINRNLRPARRAVRGHVTIGVIQRTRIARNVQLLERHVGNEPLPQKVSCERGT